MAFFVLLLFGYWKKDNPGISARGRLGDNGFKSAEKIFNTVDMGIFMLAVIFGIFALIYLAVSKNSNQGAGFVMVLAGGAGFSFGEQLRFKFPFLQPIRSTNKKL